VDATALPLSWLATGDGALAWVAVCLVARLAATVEMAAPAILPSIGLRWRAAVTALVALAAMPAALAGPGAATTPPGGWGALGIVIGAEVVIGLAGGLAIAALAGALAWAGEILGVASGLAWSDGDGDDDVAGAPRLARWVALAAFVASGGIGGTVAAVIDGTRLVPPGSTGSNAPAALLPLAVDASSTALSLAVALALPVLAALVALHLVAAILLRVGECDAGPGLLQAATALVVLAALVHGAGDWTAAAGGRLRPVVESAAALAPRASSDAAGAAGGRR
jgi:flagellar biosynthesis protein FliR